MSQSKIANLPSSVICLLSSALLLTGCSHLQPGARPLVVRAEQTAAVAKATFDTLLKIDDANRPFFKTNAPAFHAFCELLRAPVATETGYSARGLSYIQSLDKTKLAYVGGQGSDSALAGPLAALETLILEAQKHLREAHAGPAPPAAR